MIITKQATKLYIVGRSRSEATPASYSGHAQRDQGSLSGEDEVERMASGLVSN